MTKHSFAVAAWQSMYIIYIVNGISCRYIVFADAIKLYLTSNMSDPTASGFQILKNETNILSQTSAAWGLKINASSQNIIVFGRDARKNSTIFYFSHRSGWGKWTVALYSLCSFPDSNKTILEVIQLNQISETKNKQKSKTCSNFVWLF